ncbi:hypothetical protein ANRL3_01029 [Anaerolineae bacterium]|nr:hypothetical protein ANRL3_01029 [Anaerolineae bacterium]
MWKGLFTFVMATATLVVLQLLVRAQSIVIDLDPEIPAAAQTTVAEDYLEWIHPPKRGGECNEMTVIKVTWMEPRGVESVVPILWVKDGEDYGAILGLSYTDLRYIERRVWAQPVMVLRSVTIWRPCRPAQETDE